MFRDPGRGAYRRLILEGTRSIGAVLYGDTADGVWFFDPIRQGSVIPASRDMLIFGPAFAGGSTADFLQPNHYLLANWPTDRAEDLQSRFVNERNHANIPKDGPYSVVPRMWGGVTTPVELRALADAAERCAVPMIKVTGGRRIDLPRLRKEDLPAIWSDLNAAGMVSGHAFANALRRVMTCLGTEFCRFGMQNCTGLGIRLERMLLGSWTPTKVKLGVSGCPRNCAEATCKDIGVFCVDSGYEIGVAGASGMDVKETEFLCKVITEAEVTEVIAAFTQLT